MGSEALYSPDQINEALTRKGFNPRQVADVFAELRRVTSAPVDEGSLYDWDDIHEALTPLWGPRFRVKILFALQAVAKGR